MSELELTPTNIRTEIENYSREHSNDFGIPDGRYRIPMKRLMKMFAIKKKTDPLKQDLFRQLVNEHCDLEVMEGMGKVLILKESTYDDSSEDEDETETDYGYGDATPDTVPELPTRLQNGTVDKGKADSDEEGYNKPARTGRFNPPGKSASGGLSVATVESVGVYDDNSRVRRTGYRRRGSVTRYSIVGHETVVNEYKKHEDVINQFRRDSLKLERSIRNLNLGGDSNHSKSQNGGSDHFTIGGQVKVASPKPALKKDKGGKSLRGLVSRGRSRFSLTF